VIKLHYAAAHQCREIDGLIRLSRKVVEVRARKLAHVALTFRFATQEDEVFSQRLILRVLILCNKTALLQTGEQSVDSAGWQFRDLGNVS
jgi:hypothetical protein